jgi:hypothetical protein
MNISIIVGGRFHAFNLAEQLNKNNNLKQLITTYPKYFVNKNYGIDKKKIQSLVFKEIVKRSFLNKIDRNINIIVRPYPSSKKNSYNRLKKFKNIKIKEYGKYLLRKNKYNEKIRFEYSFNRKIKQILESKIIISFGSTFNIESAYFIRLLNLHVQNKSIMEFFFIDFINFNYLTFFKSLKWTLARIIKLFFFSNHKVSKTQSVN